MIIYFSHTQMCYLAVKPGFSEQCRSIVGPEERKKGKLHNDAECTDGSQCQCDAFNWNSNDNDQLKAEMQCAPISARSPPDLRPISARSRRDLGAISARSRRDLGVISAQV